MSNMFCGWFVLFIFAALINEFSLVNGECNNHRVRLVPTPIYDELKCTPKHAAGESDCLVEYDCSHITNRPANTCHFKGQFYKVGESIPDAELTGVWNSDCVCSESLEFTCQTLLDGCAEGWVGDYPKPGCHLRYALNHYCAAGQICPPFDGNAECKVDDVTYKEGDKFKHPNKKCTQCVCDKGFDGKLEAPFCQQVNCSTELENSKNISNFCAPFYTLGGENKCCPEAWICPSENAVYRPTPLASSPESSYLPCKFGKKSMGVGETVSQIDSKLGDVTCECALPPFLYCTVYPKQVAPLH